MRKILFITGSMPPIKCGVGYYSHMLLSRLEKTTELTLVTTAQATTMQDVQTHKVIGWKIRLLPELIKYARQLHPEVIHIQYPAVGYKRNLGINLLPLGLRLFSPRQPIIVTLHEYYGSPLLGRVRNLVTVWFAHRVFVSNPYDLASLPKPIRNKSTIIPISSTIPKVSANPKVSNRIISSAGLDPDKPTIAFFGFAFPSKKLENLISAMEQLPNSQLLIISELRQDDEYHAQLLARITSVNSGKARIGVTGFLDDKTVSEVLQSCTYFVQPQSIPLTAKSGTTIAAALHGLIVVGQAASDPALNLPYVKNVNALLLDSVDPTSIASAIKQLEESSSLQQTLQTGSLQLQEYFSWEEIARLHTEAYEQISS